MRSKSPSRNSFVFRAIPRKRLVLSPWHGRGREFESHQVHQIPSNTYRSPPAKHVTTAYQLESKRHLGHGHHGHRFSRLLSAGDENASFPYKDVAHRRDRSTALPPENQLCPSRIRQTIHPESHRSVRGQRAGGAFPGPKLVQHSPWNSAGHSTYKLLWARIYAMPFALF
jgi:hypothetical protein